MVVLSTSLLTRNGKVLVARQFVEMSRVRIEGLLAAFPKLLGGESRQHTFIDTESVRYVYQPIENFFLLLVTNKTSNIVEDLHTLQLISKVIPDVCGHLTEESVKEKSFEIVFAFDEVLSAGGHSENVNLQQIRTNMEMESHEEKLHLMIQKSKQEAAKDEMKKQQMRIKEEQRERLRVERSAGLRSGTTIPSSGSATSSTKSYGDSYSSSRSGSSSTAASQDTRAENSSKSMGMKLGGAKNPKNFIDAISLEDDLKELPPVANVATTAMVTPQPISNDPIVVQVEEKITVQLNREGSVELIEVKGFCYVVANDPSCARAQVKLLMDDKANATINFQTHPKVNKSLFDKEKILSLKDTSKPFPETRVGLLRWGFKSQDETFLPLNVTCWPEEVNGKMNVNLEYTAQKELQMVDILIPLGTTESPQVVHVDGAYQHHSKDGTLLWHHDHIDQSNSTGSLEFNIRTSDSAAFFPISITFSSLKTFCEIDLDAVTKIDSSEPVEYTFTKSLTTESYVVQ